MSSLAARHERPSDLPVNAVLSPPGAARWPVPPLLWGTAALHAAAAVALVLAPAHWPWALAALFANHAVLTGVGLWPRSTALGENLLRLPPAAVARREVALTIDDGPDPDVTPAVLDLLDAADAPPFRFHLAPPPWLALTAQPPRGPPSL